MRKSVGRTKLSAVLVVAVLTVVGCGSDDDGYDYDYDDDYIYNTVDLVIANRSGTDLWSFQHSPCNSGQWTEEIGNTEYVPSGNDVAVRNLSPGCYEMRVENEDGCNSDHTTGNVEGGIIFTWTLRQQDFSVFCI